MIEKLKKRDRIVLEMHTGQLLIGVVAALIGCLFVNNKQIYAESLWLGILAAMLAVWHMGHTLDKALPLGEAATKVIVTGYVVRYIGVGLLLVGTALTGYFDTVVVFIGYMSLKVTAYLQPLTHKFYNFIFHETDPIATALPDEEQEDVDSEGKQPSEGESPSDEQSFLDVK